MRLLLALGFIACILSALSWTPLGIRFPGARADAAGPLVGVWSSRCLASNITASNPNCGNLAVDSTVVVDVNVTRTPLFNGYELWFYYDPAFLNATWIDVWTGTVFPTPHINARDIPSPGTIHVSVTDPFGYTQLQTWGTLLHVTFRIVRVGVSPLVLAAGTNEPASGAKAWTWLTVGTANGNMPIFTETSDGYFTNAIGRTGPVAGFTFSPPVFYKGVTFDASQSFDPDDSAAPMEGLRSFMWDFGDGSSASSTNSTYHHYFASAPGNFSVRLTVVDYDDGFEGMITRLVVGVGNPNFTLVDQFDYPSLDAMIGARWAECGTAPESYYNVSGGVATLSNDGAYGAAICWDTIPVGVLDWAVETSAASDSGLGGFQLTVRTIGHAYSWGISWTGLTLSLERDGLSVINAPAPVPEQSLWYNLRLSMTNGTLSVFLDGATIGTYHDSAFKTSLVQIALASLGVSTDSFDYVQVYALHPEQSDFAITYVQKSQDVLLGQSASFTITATSLNQFSGTVHAEASVTPSGPYSPFATPTPGYIELAPGARVNSTVAVFTGSVTAARTWTVNLTMVSGQLFHSIGLSIAVRPPPNGQYFSLSTDSVLLTVRQSSSGNWPVKNATIIITGHGGFTGGVSLAVSSFPPNGPQVSISPSNVVLNQTNNVTVATVRVVVASPDLNGTYDITVSGNSAGGSSSLIIHALFEESYYTMTISPTFLVFARDSPGSISVTLRSYGNFAGVVKLRATMSPNFSMGPVLTFDRSTTSLTPNETFTAIITASGFVDTPLNSYTVVIEANSWRSTSAQLILVFAPHPYLPGVKPGLAARYSLSVSSLTNENLSMIMYVKSVLGSNVTFNISFLVNNVPVNSTTSWIDTASGLFPQNSPLPFVLASENLQEGDRVYYTPDLQRLAVNAVGVTDVQGVLRKVVMSANSP